MARAAVRRSALVVTVGLALSFLSPVVRGGQNPTTAPFSDVTAVAALLRSPLPVVARDASPRGSRLSASRASHAHGLVVLVIVGLLALLGGHRSTSLAPTGQEWRSRSTGRHSIWLRGPPPLT